MAGVGVTRVADCPVCLGTFKDPRVLPCGHTFCLGCITEHGRSKGSDPDCPNCRTKFQIPSNGFDTLPKNYSLNTVLGENSSIARTSRAKITEGSSCKKHNGEELVLYCVQCSVMICLDCMDDDHEKHHCYKISRYAKEVRTQLDGYLKSITPILSEVKCQKTQLQEKSTKFLSLLAATESAINEECEKNKQLLDDHRRLLLEELSNEKHKVTKGLKMKTDEFETEELRLASFNTRIEEMLQGTDEAKAFDIVVQFKGLKDSFERLKQMQPQTVGQVSITGIEFIPSDFKDLISGRGNAIGRLQKESHLRKDLTPSSKQVDLSQVKKVPIEQDVRYYLQRKHPNKDIIEIFKSRCTCVIQSLDLYDMEKLMSAMEQFDVRVIFDNQTVDLEGLWENVEKAIEQLKDLKKVKRVIRRDLFPSTREVDLSQAVKVPIELDVWHYLDPNKVNDIATKHLCISRVVCDYSNEGITHCLEIVPYHQDDLKAAKTHVDNAVEEFAQLYQKVSEPGIVKEVIDLPLKLNKDMLPKLISELEEAGVFFLRDRDRHDNCLVGTKDCIEEAKRRLSDFTAKQKKSPAQTQPNAYRLPVCTAADRVQPMNFKTPQGLTVHVSRGNLVSQALDAIVNPANERLGNGGGAARTIADAAGYQLERECKEFIKQNGKLGITCVMHTTAGNLRPKIKYVIHTVGPRKSDARDEELLGLVKLAIFNCLLYANDKLEIHSIAIPAISSGIFGVSIEIVGRASFQALKMFDLHYASSKKKRLREIYFLNNDEPTVDNMKRIFQTMMNDFKESSIDPEQPAINVKYAEVFGRQIIETTKHDNCFTRAFATALERDFQSKMDWRIVGDVIKKEMDFNRDYYKMFGTNEESGKQRSWADAVANIFILPNEGKGVQLEEWISAAANAFKVQLVLVQLSEKQDPVERSFDPRFTECGETVYIAYYYDGHHHFDALVKKTSSEEIASGKNVSKSGDYAPGLIKK